MDDKLIELKEKQQNIGDKISLLQETNKRKDEEAAEIRKLIAECRENLNRIKGLSPDCEPQLLPCSNLKDTNADEEKNRKTRCSDSEEPKQPCSSQSNKRKCTELSAPKTECGPTKNSKICNSKQKKGKDRVSCRVDLNRMKVRVHGPSEDLKKLDATELLNMLENFQCQELIINTGDENIRDPGVIRLVYLLHPGNIVMIAGIVMIAFLLNANLCNGERTSKTKFLLNIVYLSSFSLHYGMVLWMSFIRGFALKLGLCQDTFHLIDNLILPKYYSVCVLLSALSLYSFMTTHCTSPCTSWSLEVLSQMLVVVITFFMELLTICYIVPGLIKLRDATDDVIVDEEEQDCSIPQSYGKNCVKLKKISWALCLINVLTLIFLGFNLYYITSKLDVGTTD